MDGQEEEEYEHREQMYDDDEAEEEEMFPKKGLLSPSHQGRFAAMGNLVPVSSERWLRAHESPLVWNQGGFKNHEQQEEGQTTIAKYELEQYKKRYDAQQQEEDDIIDEWLLNKRHATEERDDEEGDGKNGTSGTSGTSLPSVSFSIGTVSCVSKSIALVPLSRSAADEGEWIKDITNE